MNRRAQFIKDPFKFTKTLLGEAKSGQLTSSKDEVEEFLSSTHNDELKDAALEANPSIVVADKPEKPLNISEPSWKEVQEVVRKARAASAPGPSGLPYKVYKKCPLLLRRLWRRMVTYVTENNYVDTSVQKGGIPGFSGCLEHTGVLTQLIREAKASNGDLTIVWLDLANAYGSIPHGLIQVALDHYHIPAKVKGMISSYFVGIQMRFRTADFTIQWQRLEKGIVTGCTISPNLFIMGMNLIIEAAAKARWMLSELDHMATWARMRFKPKKSRCMVIRRGKITSRFKLEVQGEPIPTIVGNPIKCLGKWFDESLTDKKNVSSTVRQAEEWLRRIEKSGLPGKFKAWLYQHGLLPRLMWLLSVYDIPLTSVAEVERKVNKHLRKWLGVPPSFTALGFYS
ncbi:uncharacterized protein LOC144887724 [Branchiostoma floridae x Branchiostoma japonicum]